MDNLFSRLLVVAVLFGAALALNAQCEIDYDFGDEPWGVSPDPTLGETFDTGMLGASYDDVLHIKVPSNANVIDETLNYPIDSVQVFQDLINDEGTYLGVVFVDTATQDQFFADELGLQVTFNNNGSSPTPYSFLPGGQYCASITGEPTRAGLYSVKLDVVVYVNFAGTSVPYPFSFENFNVRVNCPLLEGVDIVPVNSVTNTQGQLTVTLAEGVVAESIAWYNSSGLYLGSDSTVFVDNAGTFTVLVTTADCVGEFGGWLVIDEGLDCEMSATVEATGTDEGLTNGTATVIVTGAEGEWSATWFNENNLLVGSGESIANLEAGEYSVIVVDDTGCSAEVESFTVFTALDDIDAPKWSAFPNPASEVLLLDNPFGSGKWVLISTEGRAVVSGQTNSQTSIDVSNIPEGMYILNMEHNGVASSKKIAIQR